MPQFVPPSVCPREYQAAAQTAQALIKNAAGAEKKYANLPASMRQWLPVQYALARHYRWTNQNAKARAVLAKIPADHKAIQDGEAWWVERRLIARRSLELGSTENWKSAYRLPLAHGFSSGPTPSRASFWPAGSRCATSKTRNRRSSISRSSKRSRRPAPTWRAPNTGLARTYAELGSPGEAKAAYRQAAQIPDHLLRATGPRAGGHVKGASRDGRRPAVGGGA